MNPGTATVRAEELSAPPEGDVPTVVAFQAMEFPRWELRHGLFALHQKIASQRRIAHQRRDRKTVRSLMGSSRILYDSGHPKTTVSPFPDPPLRNLPLPEKALKSGSGFSEAGYGRPMTQAGGSRFGKVTTKVVPWLGLDRNVTEPPCSLMIFWVTMRPSPVP